MSDEEINLSIAEAVGWDFVKATGYGRKPGDRSPGEIEREKIPDYCHDLNAMHKAEMKRIFPFKYSLGMVYCAELSNRFRDTAPIAATARQRAEAFLRTLGKWKE